MNLYLRISPQAVLKAALRLASITVIILLTAAMTYITWNMVDLALHYQIDLPMVIMMIVTAICDYVSAVVSMANIRWLIGSQQKNWLIIWSQN